MLSVRGIRQAYDNIDVLRGVDLDVAHGEIVCLLGPSGCGKTTLLRIIAGLDDAGAGDIRVDGESILCVPVHRRGFGLMFQDFALFPHMNVVDNVRFGLRMHSVSHDEQFARAREALELVGLAGFAGRDVTQLSGGERQRVALARSLAPKPRLLMLDEPMGSLDAALRERLIIDLREIIKRVGLTALYVTHDQSEAYAIADRIAVMNAGRFEQIAAPQELYRKPETVFVAQFLGLANVVPMTWYSNGHAITPLGAFSVRSADAVLLHPDGLSLTSSGAPDTVPAVVEACTYHGDHYRLRMRHESGVTVSLTMQVQEGSAPDVGQRVGVYINPAWVVGLAGAK